MGAPPRVTGEERWREQGRRLAKVVVDRYRHDEGWLDRPRGPGEPEPSRAVTDDVLPSTIATVTDGLHELGELLGDARYGENARRVAAQHLRTVELCGQWAGAFWQAWFRPHREGR